MDNSLIKTLQNRWMTNIIHNEENLKSKVPLIIILWETRGGGVTTESSAVCAWHTYIAGIDDYNPRVRID